MQFFLAKTAAQAYTGNNILFELFLVFSLET